MTNFLSLGISESTVNILKTHGIAKPTPIQEQAIPIVLEGKDVIAQSQTGTGKTYAFILPILEKVNTSESHIQALIVTPTRELALQITNEINKLIVNRPDVRVLAIYGGQDVEQQLKKLKNGRHIVIGTPGRLLDHIRRKTVDFSNTKFLVLDEADQMLHIGFLPEVEQIISETSRDRQTMLFSATMPDEIRKLARRHMKSPHNIQVEKTQAPLENIKQIAISTVDRAKQSDLIDLLHLYRPFLGVIFCRTKRRVTKLYEALKEQGFNCDELHGDLSQAKREQVMKRFRKAETQFLIATDVAARGLDVEGVTHVFNYDIPEDTESYIHRIGRTGRAGGQGLAVTLYAPKDREDLLRIETDLNLTIPKKNIGNEKKNLGVETSGEENRTVEGEKSQKRAKKGKNEREAVRRSKLKESRLSQSSSKDRENRGAKRDTNNYKGKDRKEGFQATKGPSDSRGIKRGDDRNQEATREPRGVKRNNRTGDFQCSAQGRDFREGQRNHRTGTGQPSAEGKRDSRSPVRGKTSIRGEQSGERTNRTSDRKPFGDRKPQGQHTRTNKRGSGPRSR